MVHKIILIFSKYDIYLFIGNIWNKYQYPFLKKCLINIIFPDNLINIIQYTLLYKNDMFENVFIINLIELWNINFN